MPQILLTAAFLASALIAVSHVLNREFVAPIYDRVLNLIAFGCQCGVAILLTNWPALGVATTGIACWVHLSVRPDFEGR